MRLAADTLPRAVLLLQRTELRGEPTNVHVYIDGPAGSGARGINTGAADSGRPDVNRVHPGTGDYHGFDYIIDGLSPGYHSFWVYAINKAGGGNNPLLGVKTTRVPVGAEPPPPPPPAPPAPPVVTPPPTAVTTPSAPGSTPGGGSTPTGSRSSSGPSLCTVPKLAGLTVKAAKTKLARNGCTLGAIAYVGRRNPRADKVIGVKRRVGISLGRGAKVGVVVRR